MPGENIYATFLLRWYWLLALGILIALAATRHTVLQWQPIYAASATVQVGRVFQDRNPQAGQLQLTDQLVPIYAELAKRDQILSAVTATLNLPLSPGNLRTRIVVAPVPRTPLIDITVVDTEPRRAAIIANEIARQLVLQSPATAAPDDDSQAFVQAQLADLQAKITQGQATIADLDQQIAAMTSATDIQDARQRLIALQTQVDSWQDSYAKLLTVLEPSKTNVITIANPAQPPSFPIKRSVRLYYGLGGVIGLGLSTLLALALQFLGRAVQTPDDLRPITRETPILTVPRYRMSCKDGPIVSTAPESVPATTYRMMRNILQAALPDSGVKLAVTSHQIGEGKTTTVTNLAIALANTRRRVLLVDANPHNPDLGSRFAARSYPGFSDLLLGDCALHSVVQPTEHPNLHIVAAGSISSNYVDLLSLNTVYDNLASLANLADIVLFDTPAISEEQDVLPLLKHVDGVVVLAEAGRVQAATVDHTLTLLRQAEVEIVVVVLNKVRSSWIRLRCLPWSLEARLRARALRHRQIHSDAARAPGD